MKRILDIAVVVSAACALVVTGLVVRREFFSAPAAMGPRSVENHAEYAKEGRRMGPPGAAVTIVEFSDFQCPFCSLAAGALRGVRTKYPNEVAVVYRHFPLDAIHPHARTAALASECAGDQGRFEAYHDLLYARQGAIGTVAWRDLAAEAGVADLSEFERCLSERRFKGRIAADEAAVARLSLKSTPSILIGGKLYDGALPEAELTRIVEELLRRR